MDRPGSRPAVIARVGKVRGKPRMPDGIDSFVADARAAAAYFLSAGGGDDSVSDFGASPRIVFSGQMEKTGHLTQPATIAIGHRVMTFSPQSGKHSISTAIRAAAPDAVQPLKRASLMRPTEPSVKPAGSGR